eukprot:742144-Lingulodinium_polyedra.AAC.1
MAPAGRRGPPFGRRARPCSAQGPTVGAPAVAMRRGRPTARPSRVLEAERERLALLWDSMSTKFSAWE